MIEEALTFDDVLLQPSESSIGPGDAELKLNLQTKSILIFHLFLLRWILLLNINLP